MMKVILESLSSENMVRTLTVFMEKNCEDFPECKKNYIECIETLRAELGTELSPAVADMTAAIDQQIASDLIYSAYLGFKANLDYFRNPVANNFLNVDMETYLRENTAHRLPAHSSAQRIIDCFYKQLTDEQKERTTAIDEYVSYLETVGPKLAHYYGFIFANEFLIRVEPAYSPDIPLTYAYRRMLQDYLQIKLMDRMGFESNEIIAVDSEINKPAV